MPDPAPKTRSAPATQKGGEGNPEGDGLDISGLPKERKEIQEGNEGDAKDTPSLTAGEVDPETAGDIHPGPNERQLQSKVTSSYRYWWLGEQGVDKDVYPQIWMNMRVADIIVPGKLRITACAPKATGEELALLRQAAHDQRIAQFCSPGKGGSWSLFDAHITYEAADAVPTAAQ